MNNDTVTNNTVTIELFGAFRQYGDQPVQLQLTDNSSALQVKLQLFEQLKTADNEEKLEKLIKQSVLANEQKMLQDDDTVSTGDRLAILPPVCGG